jgi:hypothetical protein
MRPKNLWFEVDTEKQFCSGAKKTDRAFENVRFFVGRSPSVKQQSSGVASSD